HRDAVCLSCATFRPVWRSHVLTPSPSREAISSRAFFCSSVQRTLMLHSLDFFSRVGVRFDIRVSANMTTFDSHCNHILMFQAPTTFPQSCGRAKRVRSRLTGSGLIPAPDARHHETPLVGDGLARPPGSAAVGARAV